VSATHLADTVHASLPPRPYDVHVERGVSLPVRDGTVLVADVYRPARDGRPVEGRFPVLVERTPYDRARALRQPSWSVTPRWPG
jgi:predicted acyl esterase